MKVTLRDNAVTSLKVKGQELGAASPSGFLARDYAADSDVYAFAGGTCKELGLKLETTFSASQDHIVVEGRVADPPAVTAR